MSTNTLSFSALTSSAQSDAEVSDCGFLGKHGVEFAMMREDGALVRIAWSDGASCEGDGLVGIKHLSLGRGQLTIVLDKKHKRYQSTIPYDFIKISYDNSDDRFSDLVEVCKHILQLQQDRIEVVQ
jgi:hypothetical protein